MVREILSRAGTYVKEHACPGGKIKMAEYSNLQKYLVDALREVDNFVQN